MFKIFKMLAIIIVLNLLFICKAQALSCYITMVKASCWKDFNLNVTVINAESGDKLGEITVPQGQLWDRKEFSCQPGIILALEAKFSPEIWHGDSEKSYKAIRLWRLPKSEDNRDNYSWNFTVCYPEWFSDIPTPPKASIDCKCDMSAVPKFESM